VRPRGRAGEVRSSVDGQVPPADATVLRQLLLQNYSQFSPVFQRIARFILDEPNIVALETLAVVADRCNAPASTIVRFAQSIGFEGAGPMQRLLRDAILIGNSNRTYGDRVKRFAKVARAESVGDHRSILRECVDGAAHAIQQIEDSITPAELASAAKLIREAEIVYLVGYRRSFPVAVYLSYGLQRLGRRTLLIDGVAGMAKLQAECATNKDLLIAISFAPYAPETLEAIAAVRERNCRLLTLTDSQVSPSAQGAAAMLLIREPEIREFRPLTTTMCVAQALVLSCAFAEA
jgi:DNA-binding MurR/RpiR family transcriptional regulator